MNGWNEKGGSAAADDDGTMEAGDDVSGIGGSDGGAGRAVGVSGCEAFGILAGAVGPNEFADAGTGDNGGGLVAAGSSVGIGPTGYVGGSFEVLFDAAA